MNTPDPRLTAELDRAHLMVGRLTSVNEGMREALSRAYLVAPDGTLVHSPCGKPGLGVEDGEIVAICPCSGERKVDANVDSDLVSTE